MTKRLKATINPALLTWARGTAGFDLATAAIKLDVEDEKLTAWEAGDEPPSISQLRKMAEQYKRPLAVLYLPESPIAFKPVVSRLDEEEMKAWLRERCLEHLRLPAHLLSAPL